MVHESLSDGHNALRFGLDTISVEKDDLFILTLTIKASPIVGLSLNLMEQTKQVRQKLLKLRESLKSSNKTDSKETTRELPNKMDTLTCSYTLILTCITLLNNFCS